MAHFIEITLGSGTTEIVNVNTIESISPMQNGGCALRFTKDSAKGGNATILVTNKYDYFKNLLL